MDIGKPKRIVVVEPVENPIPARPAEPEPEPGPAERPKQPAEQPSRRP